MKKKTALIIIFSFMIFSIFLTSFIQNVVIKDEKGNNNQPKDEKVDTIPPELILKESKLIIYQDDILNYEAIIVSAKDDVDGDISSSAEHNIIDTSEVGEYKLEYKVKDNVEFSYKHTIGNQTSYTYSLKLVECIVNEIVNNPDLFVTIKSKLQK